MSLITGTHHINLKANGPEGYRRAVSFYTETLGMPFVREWAGRDGAKTCMVSTGTSLMEIGEGTDTLPQGAVRHFALATEDVDAAVAAVRAAGYAVTTEPRDVVLRSDPPLPARIAFCIGPCGEEIEFFCEK